ncbi:MAG: hypothetical protein NZM44_04390 [Candidatus Calescibacterium sp.]|nr:hypothetical protein [Candidatus Calescibacterium sp.]
MRIFTRKMIKIIKENIKMKTIKKVSENIREKIKEVGGIKSEEDEGEKKDYIYIRGRKFYI